MTAPVLEVRDLGVAFPSRGGAPLRALDGVSFTLAPGEVLGVVGESGAGKSVTGAAVAGLVEPPGRVVSGEIRYDGRRIDLGSDAEWRRLRGRHIATIFQDPLTALDPLFTVGDQLVETLRVHTGLGRAAARRRAAELLAETGIPGAAARLDDHPHQFSGGMRQRVVIALALAGEPRVLVADEPTTALDVSVQAQITALLRRLSRERGLAVLLITHDMGVVADTCDRVAVMYAGRIVETGDTASVVQRPAHPYAAGLMAAIPRLDTPRGRLQQIDGSMPRLAAVPTGCPFHPRCPHAFAPCPTVVPVLRPAHTVWTACHLYPESPR